MSSRVRQREKKAGERAAATSAAGSDRTPASVALALAFLAAFIALRASDLELTWGTRMFPGAVATIALTVLVAVFLGRGNRIAWLIARPLGALLAVLLIAAPWLGYPAYYLRMWSMAAALAGLVVALSLSSARDFYRRDK